MSLQSWILAEKSFMKGHHYTLEEKWTSFGMNKEEKTRSEFYNKTGDCQIKYKYMSTLNSSCLICYLLGKFYEKKNRQLEECTEDLFSTSLKTKSGSHCILYTNIPFSVKSVMIIQNYKRRKMNKYEEE